MGYKSIGKYKTLVLPIPPHDLSSAITLDQYKKIYGIDLKDILVLDENNKFVYIKVDSHTMILVDGNEVSDYLGYTLKVGLMPLSENYTYTAWTSGTNDAITAFNYSDFCKLAFIILKNDDFKIENVKVFFEEI